MGVSSSWDARGMVGVVDEPIHLGSIQYLLHFAVPELSPSLYRITFVDSLVCGNERNSLSDWRGRR